MKPAVAVVGVGHMGALHTEKLARLEEEGEARSAGVFDLDATRRDEIAQRFGAAPLRGLEEVIERADAAVVAVPSVAHEEVAGALLAGGLDVLIEKPIATSREGARALIEAARERGRLLQVGHVERFNRAFQHVFPVLNRPRFIEVHRIGPYPGRAADVSVVLDLMIHDLDLVSRLADSEPERVEGVGVPVLSATEDIANARVRFANGCILNITASRVSLEPLRKVRLFQADAYVSIDFQANQVTIVRRRGEPGGAAPPEITAERYDFDPGDALLRQDRAFVRAVASREPPPVSGEDGLRALDLALRIQESLPPLEELRG
jgi:predicted dehydrogenase